MPAVARCTSPPAYGWHSGGCGMPGQAFACGPAKTDAVPGGGPYDEALAGRPGRDPAAEVGDRPLPQNEQADAEGALLLRRGRRGDGRGGVRSCGDLARRGGAAAGVAG